MKRPSSTALFTGVMVAVLLGVVVGSFVQRGDGPGAGMDDAPAPPCPFGFIDRTGETARVLQRLRSAPRGAAVIDSVRVRTRMCFGDVDVPVVMDGRLLVMDQRLSLDEQAARTGHLLHHVAEGLPFPQEVPADADCDALVRQAVEREARAYALEVELRRAFDLPPDRYEFEPDFWRAAEDERVARVARYLREHPHGAQNLDPLVGGYRQRCEVERAEAR